MLLTFCNIGTVSNISHVLDELDKLIGSTIAPVVRPIDRTLEPGVQLLEHSLQKFPGLECLSDHCFKSARQFQRLFKNMFGMGPREYWMKLRIREACHLLRLGAHDISDVAITLGFCDQSTFTAHFRRNVGVTPARYAKQHDASD